MRQALILGLALGLSLPGAVMAEEQDAFDRALQLAREGQGARAVMLFRELSHDGDAAAQINLAIMQARGLGVPQDDREAAYWAWRARLAGEPRAEPVSALLLTRLTPRARKDLADRLTEDLKAVVGQGRVSAFISLGRVETELRDPARPEDAALWFTLAAAFEVPHALALREAVVAPLSAERRLAVQDRATRDFAQWCDKIPGDQRPATCAAGT